MKRLFGLSSTSLGITLALVSGANANCLHQKDLLNVAVNIASNEFTPIACDLAGKAFVSSINSSKERELLEIIRNSTNEDLDYYLSTRLFLSSESENLLALETKQTNSWLNSFGLILSFEADEMSNLRRHHPQKHDLYRLFQKIVFLLQSNIKGAEQSMLLNSIGLDFQSKKLVDVNFASGLDIICFVKFDLPDLELKHILQSSAFKECSANLRK